MNKDKQTARLRELRTTAAERAWPIAALRHRELGDRERLLLHAYHHFESLHGAAIGQPGICWPTDGEIAEYLGRSVITARRGRGRLSHPGKGIAPFIAVRYVPPFHPLPTGEQTPHGANVITLLEMLAQRPTPAALTDELAKLEERVREMRSRINGLAGQNPAATPRRRRSSHNAPSVITPGCAALFCLAA